MNDIQGIMDKLCAVEFSHNCIQHNTIYVQPGIYAMSTRKIEALIKIAEIQKYYQCNPVQFISDFFGIELLDVQAWIVQRSWTCPNVLIVGSRGMGKSTIIGTILMSKGMLFNNYWSYIASGSGAQAQQTFTTLEKLANDGIDEMVGSTGYIFKAEVEIKNASGDGFSHGSDGFTYSLYNGSKTTSLNSNIDSKRGFRGNIIFDESAFLSAEMLKTYGAFAIVNKSFKTGKDRDGKQIDAVRSRAMPLSLPNQKFYISSASSTDMEYYRLYREFAKRQLIGDPDFFVAQIPCDVLFHPTMKGESIAPLLVPSTVDSEMRTNPEKARREYYCQFTSDAGELAIIKRGVIARNSETRVPLLYNDTNKRRLIIAFDPARQRDNSAIVVMEIYIDDTTKEWKGRFVNCVNLIDVGKKNKTPMQTPEQIKYLRELILDYNGDAPDYENIEAIFIDAGSGGGGVLIADALMEDWIDSKGVAHKGLIDKVVSADYVSKFPNAVNKLRLMAPAQYKSEMVEALIELVNTDKISFTADYDNKGYLTVFETDEKVLEKAKKEIEAKLKEQHMSDDEIAVVMNKELKNTSCVKTKIIKLGKDQEVALSQIDSMKEEIYNIARRKRESGRDSFDLIPEKQNVLHDDRFYCACMCAYGLFEKRREYITNKRVSPNNLTQFIQFSAPKKSHSYFNS